MTASLNETSLLADERRPIRWTWWLIGVLLIAIVLAAVSAVLYHSRISEIPDVGVPFDVEKFALYSLPNDDNAMSQYLLAKRALVDLNTIAPSPRFGSAYDSARAGALIGWSAANDDARRWLEANRRALELWRIGTTRDAAIEVPLDDISVGTLLPASDDARNFARLALLEASRLAANGHAGESWVWYRGTLRASRHFCMHACGVERMVGTDIYRLARDPILNWSSRPELTAVDLRQALADAVGIDAMTPPLADSVKVEYLSVRHAIPDVLRNIHSAHPWLALETRFSGRPVLIQRLANVYFANWLAHADHPRHQCHPMSDRRIGLFEPGPGPTFPPPDRLRDLVATQLSGIEPDMSVLQVPEIDYALPGMLFLFDTADQDEVNRAAVIVDLALQLYFREHGHFPQGLSELVKAGYLHSIPTDPFGKGEPIHYRLEGHAPQRAVLWSVGLDSVNEAGKLPAVKLDERSLKDTVFEIRTPAKTAPSNTHN